MWYLLIIGFVLGVLAHIGLTLLLTTSGTLRIDHSNPDKDKWLFEIGDTEIHNKRRIVLKIDHHADLSQK